MTLFRSIIATFAAIGSLTAGAHEVSSLAINSLNVDADTAGVMTLRYSVDPKAYNLSTNSQLTLTPVIYNNDSTISAEMPSIIIAGRNRYLRYQRTPQQLPDGVTLLRSGSDDTYNYTAAVDFEPWMKLSTVGINADEKGCCGAARRSAALPVANIDLRQRRYVAPDFIVEAPAVKDGKVYELSGSAFVDFRVNRTEIDPIYRNNPSELAKIIATINVVRENPDATINRITIKGYASPEGSYKNNIHLSQGRTISLRDYVKSQYSFIDTIFKTDNEPEDWAGLRDSVSVSILPNRDAILSLIDSDMEPDAKDAAIRARYPRDYKYLLEYVYPALRHSDYTVKYTIREFTDLNEIRRVMHERPANLSLHEFYLLASSYRPGTDEYNEVFDIAVRIYPDDPISNINAAAVAINNGLYDSAETYLSRVGDRPEVAYLRGVKAALQGDYATARPLLQQAQAAAIPQAAEALRNLDAIENLGEQIEYINDSNTTPFTKQ